MAVGGLIGAVVSVAATAYSAISSYQASKAQAKTAAAYARYNATVASQNAQAQSARARLAAQRAIGSQRAAFAASGLETTSGSPLLVTLDQALEGEMAAQTALRQGVIEGVGYQSQIDQAKQTASSQGTAAIVGGIGGIAGQIGDYYTNKEAMKPRNTTLISGQDLIS